MKKDSTLAGILSFLIPGLGQIYVGKIGSGILWFVFTVAGYFLFVIPGLVVWIVNIFDAIKQAKKVSSNE